MEYLNIAIKAAIDAGEAILEVYNADDFGVEIKEDNSPLTKADKKSNDVINGYLEATPFPVISEENKQLDYKDRKDWDVCWVVDPLDGTKEFIKRNGEFTVNIALVKQGKPVLGVIYVPVSAELYYADVERNDAFKVAVLKGQPVDALVVNARKLAAESSVKDVVRVVGSRSHMNDDTLAFIEGLKQENKTATVDIVSKGSSLKFCLVAEGSAEVYPRFAPTMEWDTAAGQAICEAVGLKVIDVSTSEPMKYNKENLLNNYFVVRK